MALLNVEKQELLNIVEEDGCVTMNCQYCHAEYRFEAIHSGQGAASQSQRQH